jgi:hypothetical protein
MADSVDGYPRNQPQDRSLRASNAERDAISAILRRQYTEGRLDSDEFAERYGRCLVARTYAELDDLIADLPFDAEPVSSGSARAGRGFAGARTGGETWSGRSRRAGRLRLPVPVLIWAAVVVAAAAVSGGRLLWVGIPLFFFVVRPLLWRTAWWGPRRRWSCHGDYPRQGTTVV